MLTLSTLAQRACPFDCAEPCPFCIRAARAMVTDCATEARLLGGVWTGKFLEGIAAQEAQ